ncbi:MAG: hypothetical protein HY811_11745 [Planctomycetes bacterium]|nr:hypothetical protein [Planctomycetota bacterium]
MKALTISAFAASIIALALSAYSYMRFSRDADEAAYRAFRRREKEAIAIVWPQAKKVFQELDIKGVDLSKPPESFTEMVAPLLKTMQAMNDIPTKKEEEQK